MKIVARLLLHLEIFCLAKRVIDRNVGTKDNAGYVEQHGGYRLLHD